MKVDLSNEQIQTFYSIRPIYLKIMTFFTLVVCHYLTNPVWALGEGLSSYPIPEDQALLTTELTNFVNNGQGMGIQARYTRKINTLLQVDAGLGFSDGEHQNRIFVASNYELFPDYGHQPKVLIRGLLENGRELRSRRTTLGLGPLFTKEIKSTEASFHPFLGVPIGLALDQNSRSYQIRAHLSLGLTGKIPFIGMENLLYNFEGNINVQNSYSMLYCGISYPLN